MIAGGLRVLVRGFWPSSEEGSDWSDKTYLRILLQISGESFAKARESCDIIVRWLSYTRQVIESEDRRHVSEHTGLLSVEDSSVVSSSAVGSSRVKFTVGDS